ncbi:MAG: PD-(D/E)XK nuclease family protein [Candidatus Kapabacteria bacterium]|nr:PD-(D/E)XK nuclease family protein [Candidatus Kapabacteria bacterium]
MMECKENALSIKSLNDLIINIEKSPMFQLSLSSKELFHSNFIFWLLKHNPSILDSFITDLLKITYTCSKPPAIRREKNNFDLKINCFSAHSDFEIIIENKVKSLPTEEQLFDYNSKLSPYPKNHKFLFVLLETDNKHLPIDSSSLPVFYSPQYCDEWQVVTYADILKWLKSISISTPYIKNLIDDYICFVNHLILICKFPLSLTNYDQNYPSAIERIALDEIRILDLYEKRYTSVIYHEILKSLTCKGLKGFKSGFDYSNLGHKGTMSFYLEKTNTSGGSYNIGIQIEGNQFRYFVSSQWSKTSTKLTYLILLPILLNYIDKSSVTEYIIDPISSTKISKYNLELNLSCKTTYPSSSIKFGKFNDDFFYKYYKLPKSVSISDLADEICKFLKVV